MARVLARNKNRGEKSHGASHPVKKASSKSASSSSGKKPVLKGKASSDKTVHKPVAKTGKKALPAARHRAHKEKPAVEAQARKAAPKASVAAAPEPPPRLLRQTKTTAAALALMEKGIEHIFRKDFKKARNELNSLLETYPSETEILARARSYIQICDREEAVQKKQQITKDQLYALGVLEHNKANYDQAIAYFRQSLENHRNADYIYYSMAASLAMKGDWAESIENLRKAIELNEDSRIYAKNDADFASLQGRREFAELVGISVANTAETP
jgi:tetratricopeptide (TPR) repeat protein